MKKLLLLFFIFFLSACSKTMPYKNPNELLLEIKDYECKMQISFFSNKNTTQYLATQSYLATGKYSMEFLDDENLKITFDNSILNISSSVSDIPLVNPNYIEINQNPLFLSYFISTYFNNESTRNIKIDENSITLNLPNNNSYLTSAKLTFENNLPHTLTYFDENGNIKVNIIYNEFTFI